MLQTQAKNFAWVFVLGGKGGFIARVGRSLIEVPFGSGERWSLLEQMWVLLEGLWSLCDIRRLEAGIRKWDCLSRL